MAKQGWISGLFRRDRDGVTRKFIIWAALVFSLGLLCIASMLWYARGQWLAPLDDVYIGLTYSRNLFSGAAFRFNAVDPPSTGATSLLYMLLTAPIAAWAGKSALLIIALITLNSILFLWSCRMAFSLATGLMPRALAGWCVFAVLFNGPVVWGTFCGLDTGLAIALVLAFWLACSKAAGEESRHWFRLPALAALALAMVRPEGAVLVLVAGAAATAWYLRSGRKDRGLIAAAVGLGAPALAFLVPLLLTHSPMPSSGWAKTAWASPVVPFSVALETGVRFAVDALKGLWMGAYPAEAIIGTGGGARAENEVIYCFPPGALILALLGAAPAFAATPSAPLGGLLWLTGWLAVSAVMPAGWHHHRYLLPFFAPFIILAFAGISRLAGRFPRGTGTWISRILAVCWIAFSAAGLFRYLQFYGHGAENHYWHHRQMADYLNQMKQEGAVAASDVGILRFFGNRRVLDLKALTAPWLSPSTSRGWGSIYDHFKHAPIADRPRFAALHAARPDVDSELPLRAGVFRKLVSLSHPRIDSDFILFECDWGFPGKAPTVPEWLITDELDCGEARSEAAHSYRMSMASRDAAPYSTIQKRLDTSTREMVGDGGWVLSWGEDFFLDAARPGEPFMIQMRTYAPRRSTLEISVNEADPVILHVPENPDRFQTFVVFQDAGESVKARNRVKVRCVWPGAQHYSSFHYWAMQSGNALR